MNETLTCLLVGAFARPPAGAILAGVPRGTLVELRPEPENPYDPGAVAVWISTAGLRADPGAAARVEEELLNFGQTLGDLEAEVQLGYLAAAGGKPLRKAAEQGLEYASNQEAVGLAARAGGWDRVVALLAFGPNGENTVEIARRAAGEGEGT